MNIDELDIFEIAHDENLSFIVMFHNELKRLLQNEIVYLNKKLEQDGNELSRRSLKSKNSKEIYLTVLEPNLYIATFLMMFSHAEEWLFHIKQFHAKSISLDLRKGGITRFTPVLASILGAGFNDTKEWNSLVNFEKIRNCLLHANGRIDLARNHQELKNIVSQSNGLLQIKEKRLFISSKYLTEFQVLIIGLVSKIKGCMAP